MPAAPLDADQLDDLLADIRSLRLTLSADLSAAAGAIDEDEPGVARDILSADQTELRRVSDRLQAGSPAKPRRVRSRRALLALPAIPLVGALAIGAAAALGSSGSAPATHHASATTNAPVVVQETARARDGANATLRQIEVAVERGGRPGAVKALDSELHQQLTRLMASTPGDAATMPEVQHLLAVEEQLLSHDTSPAVHRVLASARVFAAQLIDDVKPPISTPSATAKPTTPPTSSTAPEPAGSTASPSAPTGGLLPGPHHHRHRHHTHGPSTSPTPTPDPTSTTPLTPPTGFPSSDL